MKIIVLNPMTSNAKNVVRDVVYGCWCKGKRIGGATVPPYTLMVLTKLLKLHGHDADFIDAQAQQIGPDKMCTLIRGYSMVVMSTSTMSFTEDANYLSLLKLANPGLLSVVFGSHTTFMPHSCLTHKGIDIIVMHEPEYIVVDLANAVSKQVDYGYIGGIGYVKNGQIIINQQYPPIDDLDSLPYPDVDLLYPGIDYFNPIVKRTPYMTTSTSRGCPGRCIFCTAPYFDGEVMRFQSRDYVVGELNYFIKKGIKEVYFRDDTFFVNKKRDIDICETIIREKMDITWLANARVSLMDEDTMAIARRAGCHTIKFGIESGVQSILDGMRKGYRIEQAYKVFGWAKKLKMKTHAHVMIGNPGDTSQTVEETIRYILRLQPTTATFGICTPYPGTPLFEMVRAKYPAIGDGSASDLSRLHVEGLFNEHYTSLKKEELGHIVRQAYKRFYLRPSYWLNSIGWQMTGIDDIKRLSIASTNIIDFIFTGND
ncbi:MAG: radical SAM protein [Nitrospirae bacterium]|nr:radical SAM protein [Nitrospirota bacterium]